MSKTIIPLDRWSVMNGSASPAEQGLFIRPDEDSCVRLGLGGETAGMGGVSWSPDQYLVLDLISDMESNTVLKVIFRGPDDPKPGEPDHLLDYRLIPSCRLKVSIRLEELISRRYYLDALLGGVTEGHVSGRPTTVSKMNWVEIIFQPNYDRPFQGIHLFEIYLAEDMPEDMSVIGEPMVDEFGQWIQKEWPGKTHSEQELAEFLHGEYEAALQGGAYPDGWSRWGGWLEKKFDATGYFHTHHDGRRWWLVDPDGYAFFSNGMCYGSRMGVHGFTDRREALFSWLPDKNDPTYRDAWTTADRIPEFAKRNGPGVGADRDMFNFARANMIRAFGPDKWWDAWVTINAARLKDWGFNTIGVGVNNYYDEHVMEYLEKAQIPFVWTLKKFRQTKERVFRDFPDVYSEEFAENAAEFAEEQLSPFVGNPYLIGYFMNNEPEWKVAYINLAERTFAHPVRLASKEGLVSWLAEKYGDIAGLNSAWNSDFASFDDLYQPRERLDASSPAAGEDFAQMHALLIAKYMQVLNDALHAVDPDHLNLGMRYAGTSPREMAGCEYYDVFSFNCYAPTVTEPLEVGGAFRDVPMVIGEWHIGGGLQCLFSDGLLASPNQEERGKACERYMQGAMYNKNCVGLHYFEMNNQPLLGRFDGENMEHGVIDVCNRPYGTLVKHFRATAEKMYGLVDGTIAPTEVTGVITFRRTISDNGFPRKK